jgi:orotate phosphoribosyltransferase
LTDAELIDAIREVAYLEGDFVLRSGRHSRYYLDKYRFEAQPEILRELGERIAERVEEVEPAAVRLAGTELGAVALAASASLASGLPFLIVRKEAKDYGTANRLEGGFESGELICLVEDVVTSGGAAVEAVNALRAAGLRCNSAVCVVDREEGGVDSLARQAVRLHPLFRASEVTKRPKTAAKPHG